MLIEISVEQQKLLIAIISAAQIRGADAPAIIDLAKAVQTEKKIEEKQ